MKYMEIILSLGIGAIRVHILQEFMIVLFDALYLFSDLCVLREVSIRLYIGECFNIYFLIIQNKNFLQKCFVLAFLVSVSLFTLASVIKSTLENACRATGALKH